MRDFNYFVKKIPPSIHDRTRAILSDHVAIFLPESYIVDQMLEVEEYHFVICFETPPPATINGHLHQFKKGSLICLAPGDNILVHPDVSQGLAKFMTICVLPTFMDEVYGELDKQEPLRFSSLDSKYSLFLLDALDALIYEITHYGKTSPLMVTSQEQRIAIQLIRDGKPQSRWNQGVEPHLEAIVQQACKYIEAYYTSNITVKDVSDAVYVSASYLQKIFPKVVGQTPHQYIMKCRHGKARGMLVTTRASMEEIARHCGFVNNSHFSTAFKQVEGMSPRAYRKANAPCELQ
ncbi:MAG: helix-turn-helix transcriptional regulator [Firmicutes bacterium]|nr:helix-turn-helix transcriptional regulator [Bacillota bacterium]